MNDEKMPKHNTIHLTDEDVEYVQAASEGLAPPSDATVSISQEEIQAMAITMGGQSKRPTSEHTTTMSFHTDMLKTNSVDLKKAHITEAPTEPLSDDFVNLVRSQSRQYEQAKSKVMGQVLDATKPQWAEYLRGRDMPSQVVVSLQDTESLFYRLNLGLGPLLKANYSGGIYVYVAPTYHGAERIRVLAQFYKWMDMNHHKATHDYIMTVQSTWHEQCDGLAQLVCFERAANEPTKTQVIGNLGHTNVDMHWLESQCIGAMLSQRHTEGRLVYLSDHELSPMLMQVCLEHSARAIRAMV